MATLTMRTSSALEYLAFHQCGLSVYNLRWLQAHWPALMTLVYYQSIDTQHMALLAKASLPKLRKLQLCFIANLDAAAIAHFAQGKCSLEQLEISHMQVTVAMATELAKLQLPNLTTLVLTGLV